MLFPHFPFKKKKKNFHELRYLLRVVNRTFIDLIKCENLSNELNRFLVNTQFRKRRRLLR